MLELYIERKFILTVIAISAAVSLVFFGHLVAAEALSFIWKCLGFYVAGNIGEHAITVAGEKAEKLVSAYQGRNTKINSPTTTL